MGLAVNQWLAAFDSQTGSQIKRLLTQKEEIVPDRNWKIRHFSLPDVKEKGRPPLGRINVVPYCLGNRQRIVSIHKWY